MKLLLALVVLLGGFRLQVEDVSEWIALGAHGGRALVYRSAPLTMRSAAVTRAPVAATDGCGHDGGWVFMSLAGRQALFSASARRAGR